MNINVPFQVMIHPLTTNRFIQVDEGIFHELAARVDEETVRLVRVPMVGVDTCPVCRGNYTLGCSNQHNRMMPGVVGIIVKYHTGDSVLSETIHARILDSFSFLGADQWCWMKRWVVERIPRTPSEE